MSRLRAACSLASMLLSLTATAFSGDPSQASVFRQPDVHDWRVFHRENDEYWARMVTATTGWWDASTKSSKIRLTASEVRHMRILTGIPDDDPSDSILEVVGHGMKVDQYLFVTVKSNGCLNLSVYGEGWHLKQLWSTDKLPNGGYICRQPACPEPRVSVDDKHEISIMIFSRSAADRPFCDQYNSASYVPKGNSFELKEQNTGTPACSWSDADWAGLNVALRQAPGSGETVAVVENLPALSPDRYALVMQRQTNGIHLLRMQWERKGGLDADGQGSAWDCFAHAKSIPLRVATLDIPQDRAKNLLIALEQIDPRGDRCLRRADRECAQILDGRRFVVQVGDNPPIRLTDVKRLRGYTSENQQLSEWVYNLLDEASHAKPTSTN